MLDAARAYAALGIPVFPLVPRSKEPATAHGFKDATTDAALIREAWGAHPDCNVGGRMGGGIVCIDLDVDEAYDAREWLADWEAEHGRLPETATAVTGREGVHLFYRVSREVRPSANGELHVDVRGDGSYVVMAPSVHPNGRSYYWDLDPEDAGIADADANVYALIDAVRPGRADRERPTVREVREGEGRNDYLYRLGCSLRGQGLGDDAVRAALESTNAGTCVPPLSAAEVGKIVRSVLSKPAGMSDEAKATAASKSTNGGAGRPRKFDHEEIARRLMDERGACFIDGMPAVRDGSRYRVGWDAVDRAVVGMKKGTTVANRKEVKALLQIEAPRLRQSSPYLIAFENGVLDVASMELRAPSEDDVIPNVVPHRWDATARSQELEGVLERIACGDLGAMLNLTEFMGLCIVRSSRLWPYFPVLTGEGSNGKATYIRLLRDLAGAENVSALQPSDIASRFSGAHLVGKTANLGDDISGAFLDASDCAVIKKVATGDLLFTDVKNGEGFEFEPYATMVFSCNRFPRLGDTSYGMMRRLWPVEFRATFAPGTDGYDPAIGEKLAQERTLEAAAVLAVEGLRRVMAQGMPTPNEASVAMAASIERDSDTVAAWVFAEGLQAHDFVGRTLADVYADYSAWCAENGYDRTRKGSGSVSAFLVTNCHISLTKFERRTVAGQSKAVRVFESKGDGS